MYKLVSNIDNIIYLPGELMGAICQLLDFSKGAGANGYIFGSDSICNYALRSNNFSWLLY